jgi:surfeit locus 1 family protein
MPFRPAPLPTALASVALVVLVNLSVWQARRHFAQEARLAEAHARLAAPPADGTLLQEPPEALTWRTVALHGRFVGEEAPYLVAGRFERGEPGYDVLLRFDPDVGPDVLVNRGWIPARDWTTHLAAIATHEAEQLVQGLIVHADGRDDLTPIPASSDHPERWPQETTGFMGIGARRVGPPYAAIARAAGLPPLVVVVGPALEPGRPKPDGPLPLSGYVARPKEIVHFAYSVQWALIALTLVALWAYAGVRRGAQLAEDAAR